MADGALPDATAVWPVRGYISGVQGAMYPRLILSPGLPGATMTRNPAAFIAALALSSASGTAGADDSAHVEFLWSPASPGAPVRAEAFGFVLEGSQNHQACVVATEPSEQEAPLRIDVIDASGNLVSSRGYSDFRGAKQCYAANLDAKGAPGEWTFNVYMGEKLSATETIEVARTLEGAAFYADPSRPYVLGRPNYDPSIPPDRYMGRVTWIMSVGSSGAVQHVEVETAEGAGKVMKERAIAAGYLTMFPPDPSRAAKPLKVRQEYLLTAE